MAVTSESAKMDGDRLPTWIETAWLNVTFVYPNKHQEMIETHIDNIQDVYKIQFLFTCQHERLQRDFENSYTRGLLYINKPGCIVIQTDNNTFNFNEFYASIKQKWLDTIAVFDINVKCASAKDVTKMLQKGLPQLVSKRAALLMKGRDKIVCVADNQDFLNGTLSDIGYTDIDTIDISSMNDLKELGIENFVFHYNLKSVDVDMVAKKCTFTWFGLRLRDGNDLIESFINGLKTSALDFRSFAKPWTEHASHLIFTDNGVVNQVFVDYIKSKCKSLWNYVPSYALIRKDGRICLIQAQSAKPGLNQLIQNSICFHKTSASFLESEKIIKLLELHAGKLWFDSKDGVIICTDDLDQGILKLLGILEQEKSSKLQQTFRLDADSLFSKFVGTLSGDIGKTCKQNFDVDVACSVDQLTLEGTDDRNLERCMRFLTDAFEDQRTEIRIENMPFEHIQSEIKYILDQINCWWKLNSTSKGQNVNECFVEWQDPYDSFTVCVKDIGSYINADVLLELTDDALNPLAIEFRENDYPRTNLISTNVDLSIGGSYLHKSSDLTLGRVVCKEILTINSFDTKTKCVITPDELLGAFKTFFAMSTLRHLMSLCISVSLNQLIGDKLSEAIIVKQLLLASNSSTRRPSEHMSVIIHTRKSALTDVIDEIDAMFKKKYRVFVRIPRLLTHAVSEEFHIRIKVKKGFIQDEYADVIACSNTPSLTFGGATANIIRKKTGEGIVAECRTKYPAGIPECCVAYTDAHGLESNKVKHIFHIVLPVYNPGSDQKIGQVIRKCLYLAEELACESIAIPALGVGGLKYPWRETAFHMFEAADEFAKHNKGTILDKIKIVISNKDAPTLQAFQAEEKRRSKKSHLVQNRLLRTETITIGAFQRITDNRCNIVIKILSPESKYPSYAVEVKYEDNQTAVGELFMKRAEPPNTWNDQIIIKFAIHNFPAQLTRIIQEERITHLVWYLDSRSSLTYGEQINGLVTNIEAMCGSMDMKYLRSIDIIIPDSSALASFINTTDLSGWKRLNQTNFEQGCTLEILAKSKSDLNDAKCRVEKMVTKIRVSNSQPIVSVQHVQNDNSNKSRDNTLAQSISGASMSVLPMAQAGEMPNQSTDSALGINGSTTIQSSRTDDPLKTILPGVIATNKKRNVGQEAQETELSAVINLGIIQFLQDGVDDWITSMSRKFNVCINNKGLLKYYVHGTIENVAKFEQYLENDFP